MNEDYCSYELSRALKTAGFDEPCDHYYTPEIWHEGYIEYPMLLWEQTAINSNDIIYFDERVSAPTLWQAQKWLREKKGIAINVIAHDGGKYSNERVFLPNYDESATQWATWHINGTPLFDTYEEALSAGIAEILRLFVGKGGEQS